jgi:hypothetical protein
MITADYTTLMNQASMTADEYMRKAVDAIDMKLGDDYASDHPELIAAMIQAAAIDFGTACICKAIQEAADTIASIGLE